MNETDQIEKRVTLRQVKQNDIQNISKLLIESWRNSYEEFIPPNFLENLSLEKQIKRHTTYMQGKANYFVAENEVNELIGFSSYGENRYEKIQCEKELYTIYVRESHQGHGVGGMLLNSILKDIKETNYSLGVAVFQKNPFRGFYTKNGFAKINEEQIDMGGFHLIVDIYLKSIRKE